VKDYERKTGLGLELVVTFLQIPEHKKPTEFLSSDFDGERKLNLLTGSSSVGHSRYSGRHAMGSRAIAISSGYLIIAAVGCLTLRVSANDAEQIVRIWERYSDENGSAHLI
jgi:hypothetical protein